jgi:hypothetical protein
MILPPPQFYVPYARTLVRLPMRGIATIPPSLLLILLLTVEQLDFSFPCEGNGLLAAVQ